MLALILLLSPTSLCKCLALMFTFIQFFCWVYPLRLFGSSCFVSISHYKDYNCFWFDWLSSPLTKFVVQNLQMSQWLTYRPMLGTCHTRDSDRSFIKYYIIGIIVRALWLVKCYCLFHRVNAWMRKSNKQHIFVRSWWNKNHFVEHTVSWLR